MSYLGFKFGDRGAFVFGAFGLLFAAFFIALVFKKAAGKNARIERISHNISGKPEPVSFVPHWITMTLLFIAGIDILAALLIPMIF